MGRVITGRGDVFNYRRGEMTRGMVEPKPYDYGKLMTNIQRGALLTDKAMKSGLLASGSPIIAGPRAAWGALKGLGKPDPITEAARVKAMSEGRILGKPPAAAPVPGAEGGELVTSHYTARQSGRPLVDRAGASLPERITELQKLRSTAVGPGLAADYDKQIAELQAQMTAPAAPVVQPPAFALPTERPGVRPAIQPPPPAPAGMTAEQAAGIGPETAALYGGVSGERATALALQEKAYRDRQVQGTTEQRSDAYGKSGIELLRNRPFNAALNQMAVDLGMDPQALVQVMFSESALVPWAKNPQSSASGLIQIIESRAGEIGTTTASLRSMNPIDQLVFVKRYFEAVKRENPGIDYTNPDHIGIAVFGPAYGGKAPSTAMYQQGTAEYETNKQLDTDGDGVITVGERVAFDRARPSPQIPALEAEVGRPAPTAQPITPQDLMARRQQVDSGAVVIPDVRPSRVNLGNLLIMARNAKNDQQKNWVRQLAQEDATDIPWKNLDDLFGGAYKQRAATAIEAAFEKIPTDLQKAQTEKARQAGAYYSRLPAPAKGSARGRTAHAKVPQLWQPPMTLLDKRISSGNKQRAALQELLYKLMQGGGKVDASEYRAPQRKDTESDDDYNARLEVFSGALGRAENYRDGDRHAIIADLRTKLQDITFALQEMQGLYRQGATLQGQAATNAAPPPEWMDRIESTFEKLRWGSGDTLVRKRKGTGSSTQTTKRVLPP